MTIVTSTNDSSDMEGNKHALSVGEELYWIHLRRQANMHEEEDFGRHPAWSESAATTSTTVGEELYRIHLQRMANLASNIDDYEDDNNNTDTSSKSTKQGQQPKDTPLTPHKILSLRSRQICMT